VAEDDNQVIEVVVAPEPLGARRIGVPHTPVVIAVARIVAPTVTDVERGYRQPRARSQEPIAAIEHAPQGETANWRRPVAFALVRPPPRAAQRTEKVQAAADKDSPLRTSRKGPHDELRSHLWTVAVPLHWTFPATVLFASLDNMATTKAHTDRLGP